MCVIKRKLKFENYKNCLEATHLENKINHLEKNIEFITSNKLILKAQQWFKIERHDVFIKDINKVVISSDNDKRMQSIDLTETYLYGTSRDLINEKEEIKCNNVIKQHKKWLTLMMLQKKSK